MKLGIAAKLSLLLAGLVLLAAGVTGRYVLRVSQQLLVDSAETRLLTATQVLSRRLASEREDLTRDLGLLARHPAALAVLEGDKRQRADELATLFQLLMQGQPSYFQIRLIGAADHGLELVRVDRDGQHLRRVLADDLQEKGHYPYVHETLKQAAGSVWMSRIAINHDVGIYSGQEQPSLQLAMPVVNAAGKALGLVAVNLDLQAQFDHLARDLPSDFQLYLANEEGDILIHPDPQKTFGFDRGRRMLIQDEFVQLTPLVEGKVSQQVFETGTDGPQGLAGAFMRGEVRVASEHNHLILGLTQPLQSVLNDARQLAQKVINLTLFLGLGALMLAALFLARLLVRPLHAVHRASRQLDSLEADDAMPLRRQDELGDLARSIRSMKQQIREQIQTLHDNQEEFQYLAYHDTLTGLPNRRLLLDRLTQALSRAKRHQETLALIFVDLDRFKDVNDVYGHEAGDAVLSGVAQYLTQVVREVDTVARLGGDEFVVLLDDPKNEGNVARVMEQIRHLLAQGVVFKGQTLVVQASMGIGFYPGHADTAEELLNRADQAMYRAKATVVAG